MKKLFAVLTVFICAAFATFAQSQNDSETKAAMDLLKPAQDSLTRDIVPENQHTTVQTAKVRMEYTPLTKEVRIYYTCLAVSFDQGEAMNTCLACLEDFAKDNQFIRYRYLGKDRTRFFKDNNIRWAEYSSYVRFD